MRMKRTAKVNRLIIETADIRALERAQDVLADVRDLLAKTKCNETSFLAEQARDSIYKVIEAGPEFELSEKVAPPQTAAAGK